MVAGTKSVMVILWNKRSLTVNTYMQSHKFLLQDIQPIVMSAVKELPSSIGTDASKLPTILIAFNG